MSDNKKQDQDTIKKGEDETPKNHNNKEEKKELTLEEKLKETEEKLLRSLAEIENQRRRFEKEIKDAYDFGGFSFAKEMLAVLDNLQRAKKSMQEDRVLSESKDFDQFFKNFEVVEKDLISTFEKNKIFKINCLNKKFDPNFHQAMLEIEDDKVEPGIIVQEIQSGFMFGDRLLRPSFVGISKKKSEKNDKNK